MNVLVVPALRVAVMRGGSVATTSGPELCEGSLLLQGIFHCLRAYLLYIYLLR